MRRLPSHLLHMLFLFLRRLHHLLPRHPRLLLLDRSPSTPVSPIPLVARRLKGVLTACKTTHVMQQSSDPLRAGDTGDAAHRFRLQGADLRHRTPMPRRRLTPHQRPLLPMLRSGS